MIAQENTPIQITKWVNPPSPESFSKPLIFIDFWATWCAPCIHSMSHTEVLEKEYGENILFLYLSDETESKVSQFMRDKEKYFISGIDETSKNLDNFKIKSLPQSVLLDHTGNIIWKGNPTDMSSIKLSRFVKRYKNKIGSIDRIKKIETINEIKEWQTFFHEETVLRYQEIPNIEESFSSDKNKFFFNGDLISILSFSLGVSKSLIELDSLKNKSFQIVSNAENLATFKTDLNTFLNQQVFISTEQRSSQVFIAEENSSENFLNEQTYNFEKGNNAFISDESSITIDNASVTEMFYLLSDSSPYHFEYTGSNPNLYDWNIFYGEKKYLFSQLSNELSFSIKEEVKDLTFYHISSINN